VFVARPCARQERRERVGSVGGTDDPSPSGDAGADVADACEASAVDVEKQDIDGADQTVAMNRPLGG
jgi:hypothetical protein